MDFLASLLVLVLTLIGLLPLAVKTHRKKKVQFNGLDTLPHDPCYPIVGTSWRLLKSNPEDFFTFLINRHKRLGAILRAWRGNNWYVHVYKAEHAQEIFRSSKNVDKGSFYQLLYPWLGQGLISGSGPQWRKHRKLISPTLHFGILDTYEAVFAERAGVFVKSLEKLAGKGYFEIIEHLRRVAVDIITETAMGVKMGVVEGNDSESMEYVENITRFIQLVVERSYKPLFGSDFIYNLTRAGKESRKLVEKIHKFNQNVIETRKRLLDNQISDQQQDESGIKQRKSFLDLLLTSHQEGVISLKEVEEETSTFIFAGFDTTVATLTYTLTALANHPDVMKRAQDEIDSIFAGEPDRTITVADINQMEYLDRVLKETMRCYCFVPIVARHLTEPIKIGEVTIPKDITVTINLYLLHHDPDHYPEPDKFDPERFLPENSMGRHPYAFVPFSAGPRNCLGQKFALRNTKTLLTAILRKYNLKSLDRYEDMKQEYGIVLRPKDGLRMALEVRT